MPVKVSTKQLSAEILKELSNYTDDVSEAVYESVGEIAKGAKKKLRAIKSVQGSRVWDEYPAGWTIKSVKGRNFREEKVWNEKHYRLTHLLENGHVIKNGTGRTYGNTRKFEHIGPVNDEAQQKLLEAVKEAIENA